jgi:ABC-2 type transport system permease protein
VQGQLDYYLALPKAPLPHVLVSRMGLGGWGDVAFGLLAYAVFGPRDLPSFGLYLVVVIASMLVFVAFMIMAGSLAFFIGSAEAAAFQAFQAVITFSVYPGAMFQGWLKLLVFTAIPAAFISHIPVQLLRAFDPLLLFGLLGFTAFSLALASVIFQIGLRRYESGNLVVMRA